MSSCGEIENEEEVLWYVNFVEYFEVEDVEYMRVEFGVYEEVIDGVVGYVVLFVVLEGREVGDEGDDEFVEDGDG